MKTARILIIISMTFGLLIVLALLAIGIWGFTGQGGVSDIPRAGALLLAAVRAAGIGFSLAAYWMATQGDARRAGGYALVASLLPPLDLIALFVGLLALSSKKR